MILITLEILFQFSPLVRPEQAADKIKTLVFQCLTVGHCNLYVLVIMTVTKLNSFISIPYSVLRIYTMHCGSIRTRVTSLHRGIATENINEPMCGKSRRYCLNTCVWLKHEWTRVIVKLRCSIIIRLQTQKVGACTCFQYYYKYGYKSCADTLKAQTYSKLSTLSDQRWLTSTLVPSRTPCYKRAGWPTLVASNQRPKVCKGHE